MKRNFPCCQGNYIIRQLLGFYGSNSTAPICQEYCLYVQDIEHLPRIEDCPSGLAFVVNVPRAEYGGFIYQSDRWVSIFTLTEFVTDGDRLLNISGQLLNEFELEVNGHFFTTDEVGQGLNFEIIFGNTLLLPIEFNYKQTSTGCKLKGQIITF